MSSVDPLRALPAPALKSFSLTHLLYDPSHPLSLPLTLLSLTPIFLFVAYFTLVVFSRRLTILLLALGGVGNEVFNLLIKRHVRQDRPYRGAEGWPVEVGDGYGWPSSHSQQAGFLFAWGIGYAMTSAKRRDAAAGGRQPANPAVSRIRAIRQAVYVFALGLWSVLVAYSRYHLHYHSPSQIVAGYSIGLATGAAYFVVTEYIPLYYPASPLGKLRGLFASIWEGVGGVSGWDLGDAPGGWGEGWLLTGQPSSRLTKTASTTDRKGQ